VPVTDLVFFAMGSGEYDEPALADVLDTVIASVRDALGRPATEALLTDKFARFAVLVDEIINEGQIESSNLDAIRRGSKNKGVWEQ
jgi:hypothetical protein